MQNLSPVKSKEGQNIQSTCTISVERYFKNYIKYLMMKEIFTFYIFPKY